MSTLVQETAADSASGERNCTPLRLAYFVSQYPAVSHTFIFHEIAGLRGRGIGIDVCTVNPPDRASCAMPADEAREAHDTYCLKASGASRNAGLVLAEFLRAPRNTALGLATALRLSGGAPRRLLWFVFYWMEALLVGRWMRRQHLTHLHVHFGNAASTVALIAARIFPIDFSITIHGPDEFYDVNGTLLREKVADAKFAVCISEFARSQLMLISEPRHWSKLYVRPLGVDPEDFVPHRLQREPPIFRILTIARCGAAKGLDVLLAAGAQLAREGRSIQIRIAGDGPERRRLEATESRIRLGSACEFIGAVNRDQVPALLLAADLFVLPSFAEGVPVSLMEAMASGVPCVATRIAGIPELIRDGVDGLLVPPGSAESLAGAIRRSMNDPGLRESISRSARLRVCEKYNSQVNTTRMANLFRAELGHLT